MNLIVQAERSVLRRAAIAAVGIAALLAAAVWSGGAHAATRHHHKHDRHIGQSDSSLVADARRYVGATAGQLGLPGSLWCADFMNKVVRETGHEPTHSREAKSFLSRPHLPGPRVGAIAVLVRRGGGHVGVVSGIDANGNPIVISGNHGRRVGESVYPRSRVIAYVAP